MKRRRSLLTVLLLAVAGCSEPTVSDRGLAVTLTASRAVAQVGDTVVVTVTATNHGRRAVSISDGACVLPFMITDERGMQFFPPSLPCLAYASMRSIAPDEAYVYVRRAWALGDGYADGRRTALAPGTYTLQSTIYGTGLRSKSALVSLRIVAPN